MGVCEIPKLFSVYLLFPAFSVLSAHLLYFKTWNLILDLENICQEKSQYFPEGMGFAWYILKL